MEFFLALDYFCENTVVVCISCPILGLSPSLIACLWFLLVCYFVVSISAFFIKKQKQAHLRLQGQDHMLVNMDVMWTHLTQEIHVPNINTLHGIYQKLRGRITWKQNDVHTYSQTDKEIDRTKTICSQSCHKIIKYKFDIEI